MNLKFYLSFFIGIISTITTIAVGEPILSSDSISGLRDLKKRNPILNVEIKRDNETVKILADAASPNDEYKDYPIQFDFFINRKLFASQIRSKELPGAVGVDIGTDIASPPFNYIVIAKLITPNRIFSSMVAGAVFSNNLISTFDCSLILNKESLTFIANNVLTSQTTSSSFSLKFNEQEAESNKQIELTALLSLNENNELSGTLTYQLNGDKNNIVTLNVTGVAILNNNNLSSFNLIDSNNTTQMNCS